MNGHTYEVKEKKQWTGVVCLLLNVVVNGSGVSITSVARLQNLLKYVLTRGTSTLYLCFNLLSYVILTYETQS